MPLTEYLNVDENQDIYVFSYLTQQYNGTNNVHFIGFTTKEKIFKSKDGNINNAITGKYKNYYFNKNNLYDINNMFDVLEHFKNKGR